MTRDDYERGWKDAEAHYNATALVRAAQAVLREADARSESSHRFAYVAPWGKLTRLRNALNPQKPGGTT